MSGKFFWRILKILQIWGSDILNFWKNILQWFYFWNPALSSYKVYYKPFLLLATEQMSNPILCIFLKHEIKEKLFELNGTSYFHKILHLF